MSSDGTESVYVSALHSSPGFRAHAQGERDRNDEWSVNRQLLLISASLFVSAVGCGRDDAPPQDIGRPATIVAALNPNPKLGDFVILAGNSVRLQTGGVVVNGGDVGARGTGSGPFLSGGVAVDALTGVTVQASRNIIADSVRLGTGARVGDVQTNRLIKETGASHGNVSAAVPLPGLPAAAAVTPGSVAVTVAAGATKTVSPGRFGNVSVGTGGKLRFSAGDYDVADVALATGARLEALGPVQLRIAKRLSGSSGAFVGAAAGVSLRARHFRIEVSGINGTSGALNATPAAAAFTTGAQITALVLVPSGTLALGTGARATGAFAARDFDSGTGASVSFQDGFSDGATCTPASCNDGNPCNGVESWLGNQCVPGMPVVCSASDACHVAGVCDPGTGTCTNPIAEEGRPCNDGSACTRNDACLAGTCLGAPVVCPAAGPCRGVGACDPANGECTSPALPDGSSCDDGNACTRADACIGGGCVGGSPVTCTASSPCREIGICNPATGACSDPAKPDGTACSDGNGCTATDVCLAGVCTAGAPVTCPPADSCHEAGICDAQTGTCTIVPKADGAPCSDGNACTAADSCQTGACVAGTAVVCAPAGPCRDAGVCNPATGACAAANRPDGTSCSDGNACTHGDACQAGACRPGEPLTCAAADSCHSDGACDPATGTCSAPTRPDGTACDDGNPCTIAETCQAGACGGATPVVCAPVDGCHAAGNCDPLTGLCSNPNQPDGIGCNDGDACTRGDACHAGSCVSADPVACLAADSCHIAGTCDPQKGTCSSPAKPDEALCDDGDPCTRVDRCQAGACTGGAPVVCVAADACHDPGSCDVATGSCTTPARPDGTPCDDGSACTAGDICVAGSCASGTPTTCPAPTCRETFSCDPSTGTCVATERTDGASCAAEEAMIVGSVSSDATGAPLDGAQIQMGAVSGTSKAGGRYALLAKPGTTPVTIVIERDGFTSVERTVTPAAGVGSVAVGARLTPLAAAVALGAGTTTLTADNLARFSATPIRATIGVPAGAAAPATEARLTPLSPQGLPGLLPLGWSPLAAFDVRAGAVTATSGALSLSIEGLGEPAGSVALASYDREAHAWKLDAALSIEAGTTSASLAHLGSFAIVVPDATDAPALPAPGAPLPGVAAGTISPALVAFGAGQPQVLPAAGGLVEARIVLPSATPLPSGTVLSIVVSESYNLTAGPVASTAARLEDVVLYRAPLPAVATGDSAAPSSLGASFALTPSRSYGPATLARGNVHVDVLAGREDRRGKVGGRDATSVAHGGATLTVAAGARAENTVVDVEALSLPDYVPRSGEVVPLAALGVDFATAALSMSAELAVANLTAAAEDTLLLARLERVDGVAWPVAVAIGSARGADWVLAAGEGLEGIKREGEYVVYRAATPLGFVEGTTTAADAPVPALVSIEGLPFLALAGQDGAYRIPAKPGSVSLRARVLGTNLAGSATADVTAGETATANIPLQGVVTVATVTPENGAIGVARSTQITLSASAPLDPATIVPATFTLFRGQPPNQVEIAFRLVPNGDSGVAVIPELQLQPATEYTFQAAGLRDIYGAPVAVAPSRFTTKAEVPPVVDTGKITFSVPDTGGQVTIDVPPDTLTPGSTVLITNEGNGSVVSFTVGNDGSLHDSMSASIDDRLTITAIDPIGASTTFTRSQFVGADGTVAVGPGGGVVRGAGGVELRIPDGALERGATFKVSAFAADLHPERPPFTGLNFGVGLKVEVDGSPRADKELDLAFPKPTAAPDDAAFFVYRRVVPAAGETTSGGVAFEVIDHAFLEGTGAGARVVTASPPFPGVKYMASNVGPSGSPVLNQAEFYLMWAYPRELLGFVAKGVVSGKVLQARLDPGATQPTFLPLPEDIVIARVDDPSVFTHAAPDGTFALWVSATSGDVRLAAYRGVAVGTPCPTTPSDTDRVRCATAVKDEVLFSDGILRQIAYGDRVWKANITFPTDPRPLSPPPLAQIRLMKEELGQRVVVDGIAIENVPLLLGFTTNGAQVTSVEVAHHGGKDAGIVIRNDPLASQVNGVNQIADYTPGAGGTYTVAATALPLPVGTPFTVSTTFRVVAPGGDVRTPVPDAPPAVLPARTVPADGSKGVPITAAIQVVFTEPVKGVTNSDLSVTLKDGSGADVPLSLTGIDLFNQPVSLDGATGVQIPVTSVMATPRSATVNTRLAYGRDYTFALGPGIFDLDNTLPGAAPAPRGLVPFATHFTTVLPSPLLRNPPSPSFASAGVETLGDRAYVVENVLTHYGLLKTFDISDPTAPTEIVAAQSRMLGRPMGMDLTVDDEETGTGRIVVATGPDDHSLPSNIRIYQVSRDGPSEWIGAASLTTTAAEGIVQSVAVLGNYAYTVSTFKGIQVVDLALAKALFDEAGGDVSKVRVPLNTDGQGFGREAVISTIPVFKGSRPAFLSDVKVATMHHGFFQPIVLATGDVSLVVANPQTSEILFPPAPGQPGCNAPIDIRGRAIDVAKIGDRDIAAIVGDASIGPALVILDVTIPDCPNSLGIPLPLDGKALGVKLSGFEALVGTDNGVTIFHLDNPSSAMKAGEIPDVGTRIAVTKTEILLTAMQDVSGRPDVPKGGLRTATLGLLAIVSQPTPVLATEDPNGNLVTSDAVPLTLDVFGDTAAATHAGVVLEGHSQPLEIADYMFDLRTACPPGRRCSISLDLPLGVLLPAGHEYFVKPVTVTGGRRMSGLLRVLVAVKDPCPASPDLSGLSWVERFPGMGAECLDPTFEANLERFLTAVQTNGGPCEHDTHSPPWHFSQNDEVRSDFFDKSNEYFLKYFSDQEISDLGITGPVPIKSLMRPAQRQYLMHWAVQIADRKVDPLFVPPYDPHKNGEDCWNDPANVCWIHTTELAPRRKYDRAASIAAAEAMKTYFNTSDNPVGTPPGNHSRGLAADIALNWTRNWLVCDADGQPQTIRYTPGGPTNSRHTDANNGDNEVLRRVAESFGVSHYPVPDRNGRYDKNHWQTPTVESFCPLRDRASCKAAWDEKRQAP